jgi:hypothetical protein
LVVTAPLFVAQSFHDDIGDHVHDLAFEDDAPVRIQDFDWTTIDRDVDGIEPEEKMISLADASAAIAILTGWLCHSSRSEPADIRTVAAKCEALLFWLDPNQSRYTSLAAIGRATGLTKAAISKQLLGLKDQLGSSVSVGKMSSSRDTFRNVQRALVREGRHASDVNRAKRAS